MTDCAKRRKVYRERGCVLGLGAAQKKYEYKRERRKWRMLFAQTFKNACISAIRLSLLLSVAIVPDCRVEFRV